MVDRTARRQGREEKGQEAETEGEKRKVVLEPDDPPTQEDPPNTEGQQNPGDPLAPEGTKSPEDPESQTPIRKEAGEQVQAPGRRAHGGEAGVPRSHRRHQSRAEGGSSTRKTRTHG